MDLKQQIEEAAEKWVFETNGMKWSNNDDTAPDNFGSFRAGANFVLDQHNQDKETIQELVKALEEIAEWNLPKTGKYWDEERTRPMSYEACNGSNGARDYIKNRASAALTKVKPTK